MVWQLHNYDWHKRANANSHQTRRFCQGPSSKQRWVNIPFWEDVEIWAVYQHWCAIRIGSETWLHPKVKMKLFKFTWFSLLAYKFPFLWSKYSITSTSEELHYYNELRHQICSRKTSFLDYNYLQRSWRTNVSPLNLVGLFIHEVLVNHPSPLKLCKPLEIENTESTLRLLVRNNGRILVAYYKHVPTGYIQKLEITEQSDSIFARFGSQVMELTLSEYVTQVGDGFTRNENPWKLAGLVRCKLFWEHPNDKLQEIIG